MVLGKARLATRRSSFEENKQLNMTYNTSGLTLGVLISPALLTLCSTGIKMRRNATYTSRTYRHLAKTETFSQARAYGKRLSGIASCLLEAGCFNNILALLYVERSSVVKSLKNYNNNKALHYCVRLS
jgi:predicted DNA repair protein MutK